MNFENSKLEELILIFDRMGKGQIEFDPHIRKKIMREIKRREPLKYALWLYSDNLLMQKCF